VNRFSSVHKALHRSHFFDSSSLVILCLQELDGRPCFITCPRSSLRWSVDRTVVFFNHSPSFSRLSPFQVQVPVTREGHSYRSFFNGCCTKELSSFLEVLRYDNPIVGPEKSCSSVVSIPFSPTRPVTVSWSTSGCGMSVCTHSTETRSEECVIRRLESPKPRISRSLGWCLSTCGRSSWTVKSTTVLCLISPSSTLVVSSLETLSGTSSLLNTLRSCCLRSDLFVCHFLSKLFLPGQERFLPLFFMVPL
jgi:hypothetical protein